MVENPHDHHAVLQRSLERSRETAWALAHYEREQRDQYTSKLRFGLVTLNVASLFAVLSLSSVLPGLSHAELLAAAAFFVIGSICGGYSLSAHQTRLIELTGELTARAMVYDRARGLSEFPPHSEEYARLDDALKEADQLSKNVFNLSIGALNLQWLSMTTWIGGVVFVAIAEAFETTPWPFG